MNELFLILILVFATFILWVFLEQLGRNVWEVAKTPESALRKRLWQSGGATIAGLAAVLFGIFGGHWVGIVGMIVSVIGINFLVAYSYRLVTGHDSSGMRFWKKILGK